MKKNVTKFTAEKIFFWIKNNNLPFPRPPQRISELPKKPSALKREHPALQNIKILIFFYFCGSILPFWIRIRVPNPDTDPLTWLNPNPDPKHCKKDRLFPLKLLAWSDVGDVSARPSE
jgi:hypothetical protein